MSSNLTRNHPQIAYNSDTLGRKLRARGGQALHSPEEERFAQTREEAGSQWLQGEMEGRENLCLAFLLQEAYSEVGHDHHIFLAFFIIACIIILLVAISG